MSIGTSLIVLLAAILHASWNALLRGGGDRLWSMTIMCIAIALACAVMVPCVAIPAAGTDPEKAGKERDQAAAAAAGQPYKGEGPNEKLGEAQDRANKAATDARDAQADELKQQGKIIRDEADGRADKLEAQAKQIRDEADKRADVYDDRAKAVRQ